MKTELKIAVVVGCVLLFLAPVTSWAKNIRRILIVTVMDNETHTIVKQLNLTLTPNQRKIFAIYQGDFHHKKILLIQPLLDPTYHVASVGTVPAAVSAYEGSLLFKPDLIISAGTAGGLKKNNINIGDVYLSKKIYFYDRRIPMGNYRPYGLGNFTSPYFVHSKLKKAVICSGDSFDQNLQDLKIMKALGCDAIDMEAAGVAWVSRRLGIPMVAIKAITNLVEGQNIHHAFIANLPKALRKLGLSVDDFVTSL